ncbi:MAG: hypothetical protein HYY93_10935 [Planctomycetes bacterium]|nr:hypothetical protein [Planctomycetota bacterium]
MSPIARWCAVLTLLSAIPLLADESLEKLTAPALLVKSIQNTQKQQGYHTTLTVGVGKAKGSPLEGVVRGDILHVSGDVEAFARGTTVLVQNSDGAWVTRDKAEAKVAQRTAALEHPNILLGLAAKSAKSARFDGEGTEEVNGVACRKIVCTGDKEAKKALCEILNDLRRETQKGGTVNTSVFDLDRTSLVYTIYASTADGLLYRVECALDATIDKNKARARASAGLPGEFSMTRSIDFKQYNGEIDFEVPPPVAAKIGRK